ncbi:hypothetical protein LCGC14_2630890 [marine sediment metagenome]|uniref:Uncharacterized protein n=1 Tax=marine sediment metagenome TaxID=412755 RepID=A0A0F9A0G0_9ZZZZ
MGARKSISTVVTANGQISTAGQAGYLKSYVIFSDQAHATVSFENGDGGSELWADSVVATTADGDTNVRHTFGGDGLFFSNDIYVDVGTSPKVCCEYYPV